MKISLSDIDRQRFGVVTAKATLDGSEPVPEVMQWCGAHGVQMLIARCASTELAQVQQLEQAGCFLTDTLVYFLKRHIAQQDVALPEGYTTRLATAADAEAVGALAGLTFEGYFGHYHVDPRLDKRDADLVYSSWAANSCGNPAVADAVVLIEHGGQIAAFATLKVHSSLEFEGVLFGVHPGHQGKRLYHALMQLAQNWARGRDIAHMIVSTQITNLSVQKVWCRQGFEPSKSYYTFHKWFDAAGAVAGGAAQGAAA
jgi:GNAT superfamily N-acetyltransferase